MNHPPRIVVRETSGIRRFLYPLSAVIPLDGPAKGFSRPGVATADGGSVPSQISTLDANQMLVEFAVSMAPHERLDLILLPGQPENLTEDPIRFMAGEGLVQSLQKRFTLQTDMRGNLLSAVYDGVEHLRSKSAIMRNGRESSPAGGKSLLPVKSLAGRLWAARRYPDGCEAETLVEFTACKSWVRVFHTVCQARSGDEITFTLPLAATATTPTFDFGVGGGIYGKLHAGGADSVLWRSRFSPPVSVEWSLETHGRSDYCGSASFGPEFFRQCWFHFVDGRKSLAVAITDIPQETRTLTTALSHAGNLSVAWKLGDSGSKRARFGLCYHFLNDIPPVAAATGPQSILLPPEVEVVK